jgi:hypothetical protein
MDKLGEDLAKFLMEYPQLIPFIKAYRKANPDLSIEEAKADFRYLKKLKKNPGL